MLGETLSATKSRVRAQDLCTNTYGGTCSLVCRPEGAPVVLIDGGEDLERRDRLLLLAKRQLSGQALEADHVCAFDASMRQLGAPKRVVSGGFNSQKPRETTGNHPLNCREGFTHRNWERGILVGRMGDAQGGIPVMPCYQ